MKWRRQTRKRISGFTTNMAHYGSCWTMTRAKRCVKETTSAFSTQLGRRCARGSDHISALRSQQLLPPNGKFASSPLPQDEHCHCKQWPSPHFFCSVWYKKEGRACRVF